VRVLLATYGSRGDVVPMVGLAVRLQELGAEVRVCAPKTDECAELLARAGVAMVPTDLPMLAVPRSSASDRSRRVTEMITGLFDTAAEAAAGCDALVVTGPMHLAARSVAERFGMRYVCVYFCPIMLPSIHHPPLPFPGRPWPPGVTDNRVLNDLDARRYDAELRAPMNAHRASIGLPPVENVRDHLITDHPWLAADPILGPWPASTDLDVVQTGAWILPDERPLSAELEAFLDSGSPPVCVGYGSMRVPQDAARVAIEAIRANGRRVLVSSRWANLALIDDRDDCFALGDVNHQALFPRVSAVVHHGGAGTTTAAARAGAPQVVVPLLLDQPYWAGRVADLGIGTAHDGPSPTVESLAAALGSTLQPEIHARTAAVARMIRIDGTTVAARLLLDQVA
jgi:vancomycin aglycone glucosyltransferase